MSAFLMNLAAVLILPQYIVSCSATAARQSARILRRRGAARLHSRPSLSQLTQGRGFPSTTRPRHVSFSSTQPAQGFSTCSTYLVFCRCVSVCGERQDVGTDRRGAGLGVELSTAQVSIMFVGATKGDVPMQHGAFSELYQLCPRVMPQRACLGFLCWRPSHGHVNSSI